MSADEVPPLIAHIEHVLGEMEDCWKSRGESDDPRISISSYKDQPCQGYRTFVTLGLSSHILQRKGGEYRQELILVVPASTPPLHAVDLLMEFAQFMSSKHQGVLRGEVMGPYTWTVLPDTEMGALYATCPVIFSDSLACFEGSDPPTSFVWLVPIYAREDEFIREHGWLEFEQMLEDKDPNLCDLRREAVV